MRSIIRVADMQAYAGEERRRGRRIGVVPTMGFLHDGHASLIRRARELSDTLVTTVFVNPAQFGPGEDFERYPRDLDRDRDLARQAGSDVLFHPSGEEMYPAGFRTSVEVEGVSNVLEGAFRPGHFRGVTTVVLKLLHITMPHAAVFGQKDAQQAFIVQSMVRDLNMDVAIVVAPTVREPDGLAMSSRNIYLLPDERRRAASLWRALRHAEARLREGMRSADALRGELEAVLLNSDPSRIDYIAFIDPATFREYAGEVDRPLLVALAVRFGGTRLIDNILIT
jgi:pantoate--beta-alanine ligase